MRAAGLGAGRGDPGMDGRFLRADRARPLPPRGCGARQPSVRHRDGRLRCPGPRGAARLLLPARLHRSRRGPRRGALGSRERRCARAGRRPRRLARRGRLLDLQRLAQLGALLAPPDLRRLRARRRRPQHPRVGQRRAGPARRGALGAGVAALQPGRERAGSATPPARSATARTGRTPWSRWRPTAPATRARSPRPGRWGTSPPPPRSSVRSILPSPHGRSRRPGVASGTSMRTPRRATGPPVRPTARTGTWRSAGKPAPSPPPGCCSVPERLGSETTSSASSLPPTRTRAT